MNTDGLQVLVIDNKTKADLDKRFAYHKPSSDSVGNALQAVRDTCKATAVDLCRICPTSRELSLALTNLEQVMFWANGAIARNQ